jgi:hypothetical protein
MGIKLSESGGLTESQIAMCVRTGKDQAEHLKELSALPINRTKKSPATPKEKKVEALKKAVSKTDKPPKVKKFTWKTRK